MSDSIARILDKISTYQLFNYFVPGIIFVNGIEYITPFYFVNDDLLLRIILYYISGMVLSRIGSTIIENIYKGFCWVIYSRYPDFLDAKSKENDDKRLDCLVMENNTYRTLIATFLIMFLVYILSFIPIFIRFNNSKWSTPIYLIFLIILFSLSYHKQTAFVRKRVHHIIGKNDKEERKSLRKEQMYKWLKHIMKIRRKGHEN